MFDGLEEVDERIIACNDVLDRLIHLYVRTYINR